MKIQLHRSWFGGGIGAALAAVCGIFLLVTDLGKSLEDWSYDYPLRARPEKLIKNVVIIYLDEKSYGELKQDPVGFDRGYHAKLLKRLQAEGAKMVVFDVLFIDADRPITDSDKKFAEAMRQFGKVVLGAQFDSDHNLGIPIKTLLPPMDLFRDAAAGWGLVKIDRDTDFSVRLHHPGTAQVPSLAWKAAELMGAGVTAHPENRGKERWLNYYAQEPFVGISYFDVVSGEPLPGGFSFTNKVVFVGSGADVAGHTGDEREQFRYPWTSVTGRFPVGVEIHALTFSNLMRGDWLRRLPETLEILGIALLGALAGYVLICFRPLAATGVALLAVLTTAATAILLSAQFNFWWPWMIVVAVQIPVALGWSYLFHSIKSYVETRVLETSLSLYLSPPQVKQILKHPEQLKPGGEEKTVSILFSDIASFSKISERMSAEDLVKLLNQYYETAISCVHATGGTVVNLIGDAILAIWNAPQEQPDHRERACRAALELNRQLLQFNAASTSLPLHTRVGLHTGVACVGNIGSSTHFRYTVIGENVNMASRLEGLNKHLGTNILVTREIQKIAGDQIVSRPVGYFRFKGLDQIVEVFELVGGAEGAEAGRLWRDTFAGALRHFQRKAFAEAAEGFRKVLSIRPQDGPAKFYLNKTDELQARHLPGEWMGEIDIARKMKLRPRHG